MKVKNLLTRSSANKNEDEQLATDEKIWDEFNDTPRDHSDVEKIVFDSSNYPRYSLVPSRPLFRQRALEVLLSPDKKFDFKVNLSSNPDIYWAEEQTRVLPEEDRLFMAGLMGRYMEGLQDKTDADSQLHKDLYQYVSIGLLASMPTSDQENLVSQFAWRRYQAGGENPAAYFDGNNADSRQSWFYSRVYKDDRRNKPFEPIEELYSREDIPEQTKLRATKVAHEYLDAVGHDRAVKLETKRALFRAFGDTIVTMPPLWENLPKERPEDPAADLILENLEFVSKNPNLMGTLWYGSTYFSQELSYFRDPEARLRFARSQLIEKRWQNTPQGSYNFYIPNKRVAKELMRMFADDPKIVQSLKARQEREEAERRKATEKEKQEQQSRRHWGQIRRAEQQARDDIIKKMR